MILNEDGYMGSSTVDLVLRSIVLGDFYVILI